MTKQLLVPLGGGDRMEEILPYVQDITRPNMTVVFLVHFGSSRFSEVAAQLLTITSGLSTRLAETTDSDHAAKSNLKINTIAEKLQQRGVAMKVKFYTGSQRRFLRQCVKEEPAKYLIMRPVRNHLLRWGHAIASGLQITAPSLPSSAFLLFGPGGSVKKQNALPP